MKHLNPIKLAIKDSFTSTQQKLVLVLAALATFASFVILPVVTTPGNTILFQLSLFTPVNYFLLTLLSVVIATNLSLQIHLFQKKSKLNAIAATSQGGVGTLSGITAALFGTAACSSCLATLLGLVGLGGGTVLVLLDYQKEIVFGGLALLLLSIYYTSSQIASSAFCSPSRVGSHE